MPSFWKSRLVNSAQVPALHPLSSNALFNDLGHGSLSKPKAKTNLRKRVRIKSNSEKLKFFPKYKMKFYNAWGTTKKSLIK